MKTIRLASSLTVGLAAASLSFIGCSASPPTPDEEATLPETNTTHPSGCQPCGPLVNVAPYQQLLPGSTRFYWPQLLLPQNGTVEMGWSNAVTGSGGTIQFVDSLAIYSLTTGGQVFYQTAGFGPATVADFENAGVKWNALLNVGNQSAYLDQGSFLVAISVDVNHQVAESNEGDNVLLVRFTLTSGAPGQPPIIQWVAW